ncbi:phage tail protein [Duganella levis]|uniref:phage tail protein n=1 Tax=Duganella levis TaxID=2692169 RepID=UPI0019281CB2|nr:tail fiber protein [Duganella levis]
MVSLPFIGEIQIFGFGSAPPDWALCDGRLVDAKAYPELYALIGATYGGNGATHFRLPNLTGRAVCGHGTGSGLTPRQLGESFGVNSVSLASTPTQHHRATPSGHSAMHTIDGGAPPRDNRQPYVALTFYIALRGKMPAF